MNNIKLLVDIIIFYRKAFLVSFVLVFLMVIIQHFSGSSPLISPETQKIDVFEQIRPKLEQKINNFSLKKKYSFVKSVEASADFDAAKAYGVIDFDSGEILAEKNLSLELPIASLTKIMTAIISLDLAGKGELFTVSEHAAQIKPTRMGVSPGQKWTREELLSALLLTSSNDAAEVLKEGIDQKYSSSGLFMKAMNEKVRLLGLKNTSFDNPQGFDGRFNFSSVSDLAVLSNYVMKNYPEIAQEVAKDYQFYPANDYHPKQHADLYNWNGLLGVYPGVLGIKIGNTADAGVTAIVLSEREGRKVLAILLGAPAALERDLWASQLLDLGFKKLGVEAARVSEGNLREKYAQWRYFK